MKKTHGFILLICGAFLFTSCGGGGGGGSSSGGGGGGGISFSGVTTQASMTAANANLFFSLLWNGGTSSGTVPKSTAAAKAEMSGKSKDTGITQIAKRLVNNAATRVVGFSVKSKSVKNAVPINETYPGMVSGTLTITGSINDTTGTGTVIETYVNFNDGDGYTYDGVVTVRVDGYDMTTGVMTDATMSFTSWTIKSTGSDVTLSGAIRMQANVQNSSEIMTVNMDGSDNIGKKTFRFANFVMLGVYNSLSLPASATESFSGRVYMEKYGYAEVSTASPCIFSDPKANPDSGGPIVLAGAGNSKAFVTPFVYGVKIAVDTDGNASIDAMNRYFWDNLTGPAFISLTVAPPAAGVPEGLTQHFTAIGTFSDNSIRNLTNVATWTSSDTNIAVISSKETTYSQCSDLGCAAAGFYALGTTTITATLGDMSGSATMEVTPAVVVSLEVYPANYVFAQSFTMAMGMTYQFVAMGTYSNFLREDATSLVTWSSSDNAIATVSNVPGAQGLVHSIAAGSATITATSGGVAGSIPLSVTAWTLQNSGSSADLYRVAWAGSLFVATGANGTILTSSDGKTFQQRASGTSTPLYDVARSGSTFVVVGAGGTILTSANGASWTPQASGTGNDLYGVIWSGNTFVAVGANGTVLTSPNGTAWTPQISGTANSLYGIAWSGSRFVAVGDTILTSPNGTAWAQQTPDTPNPLARVAWSGSQFVAVSGTPFFAGNVSYPYPIHISADGINWSSVPVVPSSTFPPPFIWQSSDVTWCGTQFVVVGADGYIFTSGDGINWSPWVSGTSSFLSTVGCSASQYVVAGRGGLIITFP